MYLFIKIEISINSNSLYLSKKKVLNNIKKKFSKLLSLKIPIL